jgi:hypothetical protein
MRTGLAFLVILTGAMLVGQQPEGTNPATSKEGSVSAPPEHNAKVVLLKRGTEAHLKMAQSLTSKTSTVGHRVELVMDEDLKAGDVLVAAKGSRVLGVVIEGKQDEKRKPGKVVALRLEYALTPRGKVPLSGEMTGSTKRNKGAIVGSTIAFGLAGFVASWNASPKRIDEGTPIVATVAEDFEVRLPNAPK